MINPKTPSNDGDEFDYLYYLLKDEPSLEKIAFPLFSHSLFLWSQKNMFQQQERQRLMTLARSEAELLVLPLTENMPIKNLALEYLIRYVVFKVFNNAEIRSELISHWAISYQNQRAVYDSLVYLVWQDRICKRYHDVLIERLRSNHIAKHTLVLAAHEREKKFGITSLFLASQKSFRLLLRKLLKIKFKIPVDEKESLIDSLLGEWIAKLREMPFEKLCHEAFFTGDVIKTDFIDEWRREHTQGRYPEGGLEYLDAEINSDGRTVSTLEFLEGKHESLQTQSTEIRLPLTISQRRALKEFLSNTEIKIVETLYNYPDFTQKEVAEYVRCTQSKVSKAQRKFKRFEKEIKKILEIQ